MRKPRIVFEVGGRIHEMIPAWEAMGDETEDEFLARLALSVPPEATWQKVIPSADLPVSRGLIGAWKRVGDTVVLDVPKARQIREDQLVAEGVDRTAARSGLSRVNEADIETWRP